MNMSLAVKATSWVCLVMLLLRVVCCDPLKHTKPNQLSYLTEPMKDPIKVNDCCMNVSNRQIQTPITSCKIQAPSHPCVHAVIFTSMGTEYCSSPRARWVRNKIVELKKKGIRAQNGRKGNDRKVEHTRIISALPQPWEGAQSLLCGPKSGFL